MRLSYYPRRGGIDLPPLHDAHLLHAAEADYSLCSASVVIARIGILEGTSMVEIASVSVSLNELNKHGGKYDDDKGKTHQDYTAAAFKEQKAR